MSWGQYRVRPLGQGHWENLAVALSFLTRALLLAELSDGPDDLLRMKRLLQNPAAGNGTRSARREAGAVDDWQLGILLSVAFGNLPSIELSG